MPRNSTIYEPYSKAHKQLTNDFISCLFHPLFTYYVHLSPVHSKTIIIVPKSPEIVYILITYYQLNQLAKQNTATNVNLDQEKLVIKIC